MILKLLLHIVKHNIRGISFFCKRTTYTLKEEPIKLHLEKSIVKTIREFYGKNFEAPILRKSIISAIALK